MIPPEVIFASISAVSAVCAIVFAFRGDRRTDVKDIEERAKQDAQINFKLDEIARTTSDIKTDIGQMRSEIRSHNDRLIRVEESAKQAHKRISSIENLMNIKEVDDNE